MVEAPIMAGGVSRSAGASPSQSPRSKARLQQKAQALAADLDSKLSVALKARQALPASSWRPEEVPARKSLPPQAVPSKAVKEAAAAALATEAPQQRPQAASLPRIEALETRLEEFVQKLQVEQRAREVFQEELQAKLQAREAKNGSAETHAMDAIKEDVAHLWHELRDRIPAQADLSNAASARDLAELQTRVANCEAANKVMEQKRQRKEMEGPALLQMVTASEEQMQMLRQEVTSVDRRLSQAVNDHCESWQLQMSAVKRDIESLSKATSGVESACQDKVLALSGSYAEVRKEMAAIEESWGARLQDVRSSVKSSEDSLKSIIIKDLEKLEKARPWQKDLAQIQQELSQQIQGKPWQKDLSQQQQEMSQQIQDSAAELSKSIVACQGRLSSARLDTHEKVQGLEERLSHVEKRSSEAREAWLNSEPGLRQVQAALKEVAELRDFTMDQSSKLQNNVQAELSNLEAKVLRECDTTRDFCHEQKQQVGEIHDQLRHELKEAVSNARGVAEELAQEMLRLKQNEEPKLAEQMEELKEKLVTDLVACEARLRTEEASTRQFTSDQAAQLRVAVEDLQVAVEKLQNGSEATPKVPELSVEEVKQFETVRMTKVLSEGKVDFGSLDGERLGSLQAQRSQGRQQRQELLQRLSDAESRLQQQHGLVQRQKEHLEHLQKKS